jgi:signal transduction histidine kinase
MLVATQSVLTGEETERRRLARDLHDGLGGMLSGIKLKLTNMKGNFILDEKGKSDFENALEMLDKSVHELRQVAHNMMPEALIEFGLKDALGDFCSSIDNLRNIRLKFKFYGENIRAGQNIEIALYRIAQELVNNALKHSGASEILVDLVQEPERISLTVMDNGKGFDTNRINEFKGLGLSSLKSRVDALKGTMDILSEPGNGTEVRVEILSA